MVSMVNFTTEKSTFVQIYSEKKGREKSARLRWMICQEFFIFFYGKAIRIRKSIDNSTSIHKR